MSKTAKIGDRIKVLREELGNISMRELEKGGLPGDDWVVSNGLLSKWEDRNIDFTTNKLEDFLNFYKVNREWWRTGQGPIFTAASIEKPTRDDIEPAIKGNLAQDGRYEIYRKVMEGETEYVVIPRVIFEDKYKLMPIEEIQKDAKLINWLMGENEKYAEELRRLKSQTSGPEKAKEKP